RRWKAPRVSADPDPLRGRSGEAALGPVCGRDCASGPTPYAPDVPARSTLPCASREATEAQLLVRTAGLARAGRAGATRARRFVARAGFVRRDRGDAASERVSGRKAGARYVKTVGRRRAASESPAGAPVVP